MIGNLYTTYGTSTSVINLTGAFQPVQGSNPRSILFDMKTLSSGNGPIIHTGTTDVLKAFGIYIYSSTILVYAWNANFHTTRVVNDGQWHSVLVTFDGNTLIVYIDGVIDGSVSASSWLSGRTLNTMGNTVMLGGNDSGENTYYQGQLKNLKFYDYALSAFPVLPPSSSPTTIPTLLYSDGK